MSQFIQSQCIWLVPIVTIILTILFKAASKHSSIQLKAIDYLDFGLDLSISALIIYMTEIPNTKNTFLAIWLFAISIMLMLIVSTIVSRTCWNTQTGQIKLAGVIIFDVLGIILLLISILFIGGVIS